MKRLVRAKWHCPTCNQDFYVHQEEDQYSKPGPRHNGPHCLVCRSKKKKVRVFD